MPAKRQPKGKGKALATTLDSITVAIEPDELAPSPAHTSFDTPPPTLPLLLRPMRLVLQRIQIRARESLRLIR